MEQEIIFHSRLRFVNILMTRIYDRNVHMHSDFELLYVLDGSGAVTSGGQTLPVRPGSLLLLNSGDAHSLLGVGDTFEGLFIQFSNHFLREYFPNVRTLLFPYLDLAPLLPPRASELILRCALRFFEGDGAFQLDCVAALAELLSLLLTHVPYKHLSELEYNQRKKRAGRLYEALNYIEEHHQQPIRLQDVAAVAGVTPTHLSHLFSQQIGVTFQSHLATVRMDHAVRLLAGDGGSMTSIAAECGFSEVKYMNKAFLSHYGVEPREFRSRLHTQSGWSDLQEVRFSDAEALRRLRQLCQA